ncbi:pilus assembly protein PilM, partial [PVC group bacterium]|nr:pilus assembly protein PilM [PVC group bacterium]
EIKCRHGLIFWTTHVKQKNTSALPTPGRDPSALVYYGINSLLENLVIDIEHTFKYFSYQVSQSQITKFDRVLLSGGGVNLLYLDQFLSERFGVPVERVDPFRMFSLAAIMQSQNLDFPSIQSGFAVCAGLALGQKTKDQSRVNFIPKKELTRRQEVFQTMMKAPVLAFAAMVIIMISLTVYNAGLLRHYQTKTKGVSLDVKRSKMILGKEQSHQMKADQKEAELINRREMLRARRDFLKSAFREPKDFSKALNDLSLVVPDNIRLTKLKYEGIRMMLTGETDQLESVGDLISSIKSLGSFESAEYEYSRHEPETNNYIFEIIVKVRL